VGYQILNVVRWIACYVKIPVENHVISPDRTKWIIRFEVHEGDGCHICNTSEVPLDVKRFNSGIEELERNLCTPLKLK
jgi:hypothetical protein